MSLNDWILSLHLLSAFAYVGAEVVFWAMIVALSAGDEIPEWVRTEFPALPEVMARSAGRAGQYEAGIVSIIEAALLAPRVGDTFEAIVVDLNERRGGGLVAIREPAVTARCTGDDLPLGGRIDVRLQAADVMQRLVRFEPA